MSEDRAELPGRGETEPAERTDSTRFDPSTPDASGTTLTLAEAARTFEVSTSTLRRRLDAGEIPGAHKAPGPKGEEWRLPVAALVSLGYRRREEEGEEADEPAAAAPSAVLDALLDELRALRDERSQERRALMAAEQDRTRAVEEREAARIEAARAQAEAEARREQAERLAAEVERLREEAEAERRRREEAEGALGWMGRRRLRRERDD